MSQCDRCPVAGEDISCRAGAFCAWMSVPAPDPVHVRHIRAVALKDADRPLPPQAAVPCDGRGATVVHTAIPDIPLAGDVVEAIARRIGADRLARWWERQTGIPCGCEGRKELLNRATGRLLRWAGMR